MNENMNANDVNDVATNANVNDATNNDTTTTTRTRATTRALTNAKLTLTKKMNERVVKIDDENEIKIVRTSSNALRIDHSLCEHATQNIDQKRARAICRARVARMNAK